MFLSGVSEAVARELDEAAVAATAWRHRSEQMRAEVAHGKDPKRKLKTMTLLTPAFEHTSLVATAGTPLRLSVTD